MNQDRMKSEGDRNRPSDMEKAGGARERARGSDSSSERGSSSSSRERSSGSSSSEHSREECEQDELSDRSSSER